MGKIVDSLMLEIVSVTARRASVDSLETGIFRFNIYVYIILRAEKNMGAFGRSGSARELLFLGAPMFEPHQRCFIHFSFQNIIYKFLYILIRAPLKN